MRRVNIIAPLNSDVAMKILVSGASSFVGSFVATALARQGHNVVGTFRRHNLRVERLANEPRVKMAELNLASTNDFFGLPSDLEAIVHNAGSFPWTDVSIENVLECNIAGTLNFTNWMRRQKLITRVVTYSTLSVYGNVLNEILTENTPVNSNEIYGLSKLASENLMTQTEGYKDQLIIRLPIVLGNQAHRAFIPRMVENFRKNITVEIRNPNKLYNSMTTQKAVAELTNDYLKSDTSGKHLVNLGAEKPMTVLQIAKFLKETLSSKSVIFQNEVESNCYLIDNSRATNLGYKAPTVRDALEYYAKDSGWL